MGEPIAQLDHYRLLGRSGLRVSPLCLGAMTFGGQTSAADAEKMIHMFLDEGHTWIDTAYIYTEGRSERILGRIIQGSLRQKVFLATKVYPGSLTGPSRGGLRPAIVRSTLDTSLRRLKTDYIDLLLVHDPRDIEPVFAPRGALEALAAQRARRGQGDRPGSEALRLSPAGHRERAL